MAGYKICLACGEYEHDCHCETGKRIKKLTKQRGELLDALKSARSLLADCGQQDTDSYPAFQKVCRAVENN